MVNHSVGFFFVLFFGVATCARICNVRNAIGCDDAIVLPPLTVSYEGQASFASSQPLGTQGSAPQYYDVVPNSYEVYGRYGRLFSYSSPFSIPLQATTVYPGRLDVILRMHNTIKYQINHQPDGWVLDIIPGPSTNYPGPANVIDVERKVMAIVGSAQQISIDNNGLLQFIKDNSATRIAFMRTHRRLEDEEASSDEADNQLQQLLDAANTPLRVVANVVEPGHLDIMFTVLNDLSYDVHFNETDGQVTGVTVKHRTEEPATLEQLKVEQFLDDVMRNLAVVLVSVTTLELRGQDIALVFNIEDSSVTTLSPSDSADVTTTPAPSTSAGVTATTNAVVSKDATSTLLTETSEGPKTERRLEGYFPSFFEAVIPRHFRTPRKSDIKGRHHFKYYGNVAPLHHKHRSLGAAHFASLLPSTVAVIAPGHLEMSFISGGLVYDVYYRKSDWTIVRVQQRYGSKLGVSHKEIERVIQGAVAKIKRIHANEDRLIALSDNNDEIFTYSPILDAKHILAESFNVAPETIFYNGAAQTLPLSSAFPVQLDVLENQAGHLNLRLKALNSVEYAVDYDITTGKIRAVTPRSATRMAGSTEQIAAEAMLDSIIKSATQAVFNTGSFKLFNDDINSSIVFELAPGGRLYGNLSNVNLPAM